jgi:hypothetical protein
VPSGKAGKVFAEHAQHHLPVAGHAQKFLHARVLFEELRIRARIVRLGVEQVDLAELHLAGIQAVDVAVHLLAAQRVVDGMQQRGFARTVFALQHDQRMRQIHDHGHVEIQVDEDGMRQDLEVHQPSG